MKRLIFIFIFACLFCLMASGVVHAIPIEIKFTTDALGFGNSDLNRGGTIDADMPGFFTSPVTGQGSVLQVQSNGLAGFGTATNPLLVTVTAKTHMDVEFDLPSVHDYQAGILYISKEGTKTPDGKDEGLGVRAFTVDSQTACRELDPVTGEPLMTIEGSKDVSGGSDNPSYDSEKPNGPPHVDEAVNFDFNPQLFVEAKSIELFLSKFSAEDVIDVQIKLVSGLYIELESLRAIDTSLFEQIGGSKDKLWKFKFSGIDQLGQGGLIDSFSIRANDKSLSGCITTGTSSHLMISGMNVGVNAVPEPATILILGFSSLMLFIKSRTQPPSRTQPK